MRSRVYVGAVLAVSFAALSAGLYGCTAIVSFDDKTGDGGKTVVVTEDSGGGEDAGDDATMPGEDAGGEDSSVVDSSMGEDAAPDAADSAPTTTTYVLPTDPTPPSGSSSLVVPNSCSPCSGYTSVAWTCGIKHNNAGNCSTFDQYAIYECNKNVPYEDLGYECPSGMPCNSGGSLNAYCDPCGTLNDGAYSFSHVNAGVSYCIQCTGHAGTGQEKCGVGVGMASCPGTNDGDSCTMN